MEGENEYDLTKFVNIRSFSWTGPQSKEDFDAIKDCLAANAGHLEVLNLDLMDWSKADDFWYIDHTRWLDEPTRRKNFFADDILGLPLDADRRSSGVCFPVLRHLLLGQVSFDSAITRLVNAFSIFQLKQLKLWNCPQTVKLLEHLTEARQDLELESLEVTCGDLYLCLPIVQWDEVVDSVCSHLETLERVTIHARTVDIDDESPYFEEEADGDPTFCGGFFELFTKGDCDVVGIQYPPTFARKCLQPHAKDVSCRLLHLRAAGDSLTRRDHEFYVNREEIDSFADWVFGPNGFSELLVLAYGDFAFPDIHEDKNVLYCRNNVAQGEEGVQPTHFKILEPADEPLWDWVQGNMDALSACAYTALLRV
ncbi:uncharacterized protein PV06_06856 [Exophiala oligosperma]|uniref:Uncharacterized protein n=2 Tax=Chaetothyriales TaxID=34395 RepID=A0A0D2E0F5_9EURO|nr:uncharacterized protein PV06_06856 [Exophiala oligosperma]KIW41284.1 hypothetical protein PV06_06856 [Exophiala oligosperma]